MKAFLMASAVAASLLAAGRVSAAAGLTQSVYHNIPMVDYYPSDATLDSEQAYFASHTPDYSFVNTNDSLRYSDSGTIAGFFGADAAGAALTDGGSPSNFGFVASGSIVIGTGGNYTFSLGDNYNDTDDAARLYIDGTAVVAQGFNQPTLAQPSTATIALSGGDHSFELVYYQLGGDEKLSYSVSGAGPVSYETISSVSPAPEPASWAMMVGGFGLLGGALRRRGTATAFA